MYSETDLEAAVAAGALSPEAADSLRAFVAASRAAPAVDEEHFRLLTGFNDIFVVIAAVILLVAVAWIGNYLPPHVGGAPSPAAGALVAATSWGLAEFFTRRRRMALPSIVLLLSFVIGLATMAYSVATIAIGEGALVQNRRLEGVVGTIAAAAGAAAAWLHWRRFKVPITVAAGAGAVVGLTLALLATILGDFAKLYGVMLTVTLLLGVGVFLLAMRWDAADPRRETRRADVAFWLHLLAAPLIVHSIFSLLGLNDGDATVGEALVVLLVYVLLGATALAIDRRALLVSALAYVLWALSNLFERFGAVELSVALTAFVIGSALLLLSAFWAGARRKVVQPLPAGLRSKLPVLDRPALNSLPAS